MIRFVLMKLGNGMCILQKSDHIRVIYTYKMQIRKSVAVLVDGQNNTQCRVQGPPMIEIARRFKHDDEAHNLRGAETG